MTSIFNGGRFKMKKILFFFFVVCLLIISVFIVVSPIARIIFNQKSNKEISNLFSEVEHKLDFVTEEEVSQLPHNVQKWLFSSGIIGKEKINTVSLKQNAEMRLDLNKKWMPVEAEQYFTTNRPGFIWRANIKMMPFFHISGRDKYQNGKGNMKIKLLSFITVANSEGKEIDQGSLLRYLAEMMWFPTAVTNEYLTWEDVDSNKSKATMTYGDIIASGIFTFNDLNEPVLFEAERYGEFSGKTSLETWSITVRDYKDFEGIRIPTKGEVTWKLDEGNFNWFNFELVEIKYNNY